MELFEVIGVGVCAIVGYVVITAIIGYMLADFERTDYLPWMMWWAGCVLFTIVAVAVYEVLL